MGNNTPEKTTDGYVWRGLHFVKWLLIVVAGAWLFKSCLFSVYYIPSGSMSPTLQAGDYVLVSKFPYNLRSPEYYPLTGIRFPAFSADGLGEVQRGDIMIFDLPLFPEELHPTQKEDYIKRCTGVPDDTVLVYDGGYYLQKNDRFNSGRFQKEYSATAFPIPENGTSIQLADSAKGFWEPILIRDGNTVAYDSPGHVLVNGERKARYQVQQNYYFVMGDNARFSSDSRAWGLVPRSNLIGRAELKLWPWPPKWL